MINFYMREREIQSEKPPYKIPITYIPLDIIQSITLQLIKNNSFNPKKYNSCQIHLKIIILI